MCTHCYKLASDEQRYEMLRLLRKKPHNVSELTEHLGLSQPTVTHHLKLLAGAGLVRMRKQGREHHYELVSESECFQECGLLTNLQ